MKEEKSISIEFDESEENDKDFDGDEALFDDVSTMKEALNKCLDQLAKIANKVDEHINERDAHNPAVMYKNK